MKKLIAGLLLSLSLLSPVTAAERIVFSPGGSLGTFIENYNNARTAESKFIIDGPCISACTLITALIDFDKVCTTWRGVLAFHTPYYVLPDGTTMHAPEATKLMGQMYPAGLKELLKERGLDFDSGEAHPELVYVRGDELYKVCDNG